MTTSAIPPSFNLLRWFSIASLAALLPVAAITGSVLSHFLTQEALQRDAALTAQFIQNCVDVEGSHLNLGPAGGLAQFLDPDVTPAATDPSPAAIATARRAVLEHLENLPDVLLTSLFARDGRIVWSTNPSLIGSYSTDNDELEQAFSSKIEVSRHHAGTLPERHEQRFVVQPKNFFVENYFPLHNTNDEVVLVAEVYKEPGNLMDTIARGQTLVWLTTLAAGVAIYLGLFSIVRRGSNLLAHQQRQLVDTESLVFVGEMATALAHSLRNPLASVRSSAELALETTDLPVRKNAQDIIAQVDFLSKWVRELLVYSRPLTGEAEPVDLCAVLEAVLESFAHAFGRAGITLQWQRRPDWRPMVRGNTSLITLALHSVVANAVEAMPAGGQLHIDMRALSEPAGVEVLVTDTGVGMTAQQLSTVFKPFHTTKRHGLGLGLPMLKRAMDRFGGAVTVASTQNVGTQLRLHFRSA